MYLIRHVLNMQVHCMSVPTRVLYMVWFRHQMSGHVDPNWLF